jgi:acetyl/propionyl-CoA carboxylase alpha subunit
MRTVLIANRGEIAVRIIRACHEAGLEAVAVFSEVDRDALHVRLADASVALGPEGPGSGYLDIGRLLEAARQSGADAVHPGYGFLAESPRFAAAVREAGLTFIGPPAEVIARVGNKGEARRLAAEAGVPVVPGYAEQGATDARLTAAARRVGLPLLVKAAAGGGGRGMRRVERTDELAEALAAARREAQAAFGSDELLLESSLPDVHHIEVQVLADARGTVVSLGERECSIQRRHQKIIEEAPSPFVTPPLRARLCEAAEAVARAAGYVNAGTVEFLVEPDGRFHFLEVNTRLQVEHPITEAVTGVDLVKAQLRIAAGNPLPVGPVDMRGHAIECRVYAEDPARDFSPSPGPIWMLDEPSGPGIRVDSGLRSGWRVPVAYDPLLAKVITWDRTRDDAVTRMEQALSRYVILGCRTNTAFLKDVIRHEAFRRGETTTRFLERYFQGWRPATPGLAIAAAAAAEVLRHDGPFSPAPTPTAISRSGVDGAGTPPDPWDTVGPWRMGARGA